MSAIKKAWLTGHHDAGLASLSLESAKVMPDFYRVQCDSQVFPAEPTPEHPLRHTLVVGLFDDEDLEKIRDAINRYLNATRLKLEGV